MLEDGSTVDLHRPAVERAVAAGQFFWLDLTAFDEKDATMLRDVFGFHALAVEDAEHFGQRPKIDEYDDFFYLVVHIQGFWIFAVLGLGLQLAAVYGLFWYFRRQRWL
jgi:Mg2+ and Co2+ transporter CorA